MREPRTEHVQDRSQTPHQPTRRTSQPARSTSFRSQVRYTPEPLPHPIVIASARAIENGANALAEGFLFGVAALIIIGETWRSSRSLSKRRDDVNDKLEDLSTRVHELSSRLDQSLAEVEERLEYERQRYYIFVSLLFPSVDRMRSKFRNDELGRILERVVEIGLRGRWAEFEETSLMLPRIQLVPQVTHSSSLDVDGSSLTEGPSSLSTSDSQS